MEVVKSWEEKGVSINEPYKRHLKVSLAPDKRGVNEITFSYVYIDPHSQTDYHEHDRPELIIVLSGRGVSVCDEKKERIEPDMALWILAGEKHQIVNDGDEMIKLATVFVPAYKADTLLKGIREAAQRDRS